MRKFTILILFTVICCGPSEDEIKAIVNDDVDKAISSTSSSTILTTSSTTTTTVADSTTTTTSSTTTTTVVLSLNYPQLIISEVTTSIPEYNRDDWNHWIDENGDCQNTRHEVLIEESFESVTYTNDTNCSVSTGKWFDNYTGQYYYNASEIEIDHFIPLKNAHQSGGFNWSSTKKEEFANYRFCLLYTSPSPRDGLLSRMPSSA